MIHLLRIDLVPRLSIVVLALAVSLMVACSTDSVVAPSFRPDPQPRFGMVDPCTDPDNGLPDEPQSMTYAQMVAVCYALQGIPYGGVCDNMFNFYWDALAADNGLLQAVEMPDTILYIGRTTMDTVNTPVGSPDNESVIKLAVFVNDPVEGTWTDRLPHTLRAEYAHGGLNLHHDHGHGNWPHAHWTPTNQQDGWAELNCSS